MRCRLLAIDLDGTLLRDDGTVAPSDRDAIELAQDEGMVVTLATGRLPDRTLPLARSLRIEAPLICADGAITVMSDSTLVRPCATLSTGVRKGLLELAARLGLPVLFLTSHSVLGLRANWLEARALSGWSG